MKVRRYLVNDMSEAMTQIRIELGKEAVILSQRKVKAKGVLGFLKPKQLEVTAAVENSKTKNDLGSHTPQASREVSPELNDSIRAMKEALKLHSGAPDERESAVEKTSKGDQSSITDQYREKIRAKETQDNSKQQGTEIMKELNQLKSMIKNINGGETKDSHDLLKETLEEYDIDKNYFSFITDKMPEESYEEAKHKPMLKKVIEEELEYIDFPKGGRVVLAGPTGVGKTTTIAKLAGKYALQGSKKVGLITIDTYRIGAVEQLKTYAEIMNLPIKVVFTLKEMEQALEELSWCDVVLVDTTGRSSKNSMQVSELRSFIDKVETDNIFLVVSATTKNKDIQTIIDGFSSLNYSGLVMTKLDETNDYGVLFNAHKRAGKPISLVTIGQNVPDDIKEAKPEYISELIVGEEKV